MANPLAKPIAVLGAGSWGTALALHLSRMGQEVRLWSIETDHIETMVTERTNTRYLPGPTFPDSLHPVPNLQDALNGATDILVVVPSVGYRATLNQIKPFLHEEERIISATKGLDLETGQLLHDVATEILGTHYSYAVLSGPSFAGEVGKGLPTAVVIASKDVSFAKDALNRFNSPLFRVYLSKDVVGVETGAVVKNVLAIACGISDGMSLGSNARSVLITLGLAEMTRLGTALGAEYETFMGLSGIGDLVLTCSDDQSRNRRFGLALGKHQSPEQAEKEIGQVVEGKRNVELVIQLAKKYNIHMPISEMVWQIILGRMDAKRGMDYMLSQEAIV